MTYGIFDDDELELINASRIVLADGVRRLQERNTLFAGKRSERRACLEARGVLTDKLIADYGNLRHEVLVVCFFDAAGRLITVESSEQGRTTECEINPRVLVEQIIRHGANAVLFAHNHPSGNNTPSNQDLKMTQKMGEWLQVLDCTLIDHLVLNGESATSITGEWHD